MMAELLQQTVWYIPGHTYSTKILHDNTDDLWYKALCEFPKAPRLKDKHETLQCFACHGQKHKSFTRAAYNKTLNKSWIRQHFCNKNDPAHNAVANYVK